MMPLLLLPTANKLQLAQTSGWCNHRLAIESLKTDNDKTADDRATKEQFVAEFSASLKESTKLLGALNSATV